MATSIGVNVRHLMIAVKKPKLMNETVLQQLVSSLELNMNHLVGMRYLLSSDKKAWNLFLRFIAPVQMGDEKSDDFAMPFKLEVM